MLNKILFLTVAIFSFHSFPQNYDYIDTKAKNYSNIINTTSLSNKIKSDFNTDEEKVRALFIWLVENMHYYTNKKSWSTVNLQFYFSKYQEERETRKKEKARIEKAMKNKKANCYGFSLIFNEVCSLLNIESKLILGFAKGNIVDIGKNNTVKNHTWNVVKINNEWQLIDITWAIGYRLIDKKAKIDYYYLNSPTEFLNQHLPANPKWQLTPNKVSKEDFISTPILYPKYYNSEFKLSAEENGIIKISKKSRYFTVHFDEVPKEHIISYAYLKDSYSKPLIIKKNDNGTYKVKIKFNKKQNSYLTIYSDLIPLIGYKIELTD